MERLLWVSLGSALGGGARYLLSQVAQQLLGSGFPFGTLVVNLAGSFGIGLVMYVGLETSAIPPGVRLFLTAGVLGGLTTYSAFNYETIGLASEGDWLRAGLNIVATFAGCGVAGLLGLVSGRAFVGSGFFGG